MKKVFIVAIVVLMLLAAFALKPDNKSCIIAGVKAVWGNITPDPYKTPAFFEEFMNLNSRNVDVKDWIFFKQVVYTMGKEHKTVGIGVFKKIFVTVKPIDFKGDFQKGS